MKLAIPSEDAAGLDAQRSGHFGHCKYFTIVQMENGQVTSVESVQNVDHDAVGCGGVISFAIDLGIDAILAAGMGRPPFMRFTEAGIDVYIEQNTPRVADVLELFKLNLVPKMQLGQACSHH